MSNSLTSFILILPVAFLSIGAAPPPDPMERAERQVTEVAARVRACAVEVEYQARRGASTVARAASGVAIEGGDLVASVGIPRDSEEFPIRVTDFTGKRFKAHWRGADSRTGLTLLDVSGLGARPVPMAPESTPPGGTILLMGNPFGLAQTVKFGHVSGLDRDVMVGDQRLCGLVQLDAPIHPGDNGALVANLRGELIGIVRSCLVYRGPNGDEFQASNIGFAIPASQVRWIVDQIRRSGDVRRGYLGLIGSMPEIPNEGEGALVRQVVAGSPADRAGLKPADRITAIDGHAVRSFLDIARRMETVSPDTEVLVTVAQEEEARTLRIRAGQPPKPPHNSQAERRDPTERERKLTEEIDHLQHQIDQLQHQLQLPLEDRDDRP